MSFHYWVLNDPFHYVPLLMIRWSLLLLTPQQRLPMLFNGQDNPQKLHLPVGGSRPPSNTWFFGPTWVSPPYRYLDQFSYFCNRHTDRPCCSVCSNRPHLAIAVIWPEILHSAYTIQYIHRLMCVLCRLCTDRLLLVTKTIQKILTQSLYTVFVLTAVECRNCCCQAFFTCH